MPGMPGMGLGMKAPPFGGMGGGAASPPGKGGFGFEAVLYDTEQDKVAYYLLVVVVLVVVLVESLNPKTFKSKCVPR